MATTLSLVTMPPALSTITPLVQRAMLALTPIVGLLAPWSTVNRKMSKSSNTSEMSTSDHGKRIGFAKYIPFIDVLTIDLG